MMKLTLFMLMITLLLPSFTLAKESARPIEIGKLQVLKIDGRDQRAVIKTPDGKMQIIKPGDVLQVSSSMKKSDKSLRVADIAEGRVVFEEKRGQDVEKIIIRLENGKQRVERVRKALEKQQGVYRANVPLEKKQIGKESVKEKTKKDKKSKSKQQSNQG